MARRFTIQLLMNLASRIGANPAKAISRNPNQYQFFRKRPYKESLVPEPFSRTRECNGSQSRETGNVVRSDRRCCRLGERWQTQ